MNMKLYKQQSIYILFLIAVMFLLVGCGRNTTQPASENRVFVRTPRATFTLDPASQPKPQTITAATAPVATALPGAGNTIQPNSDTEMSASQQVGETAIELVSVPAQAVINIPLVNARSGPGTDYPLVEYVEENQKFEIIGKNIAGDWWKICCVPDKPAWVIDDYVDLSGPLDLVPVAPELLPSPTPTSLPTPLPTNTPIPILQTRPTQTPVQGLVLADSAITESAITESTSKEGNETEGGDRASRDEYSYDLIEREQFSESSMVRIYLYIYDAATKESLSDYTLRILQNGTEWPIYSGTSSDGPPAVTWPFQDTRQRSQNFKVELPDVAPAGIWSIQLLNPDGNPVGLEAIFALSEDDPNRELYISYARQ